jgi:hypothetical protein
MIEVRYEKDWEGCWYHVKVIKKTLCGSRIKEKVSVSYNDSDAKLGEECFCMILIWST